VDGFDRRATVIHRQFPEFGEVGETLRLERDQNCAESGCTIEEMTQEQATWPRIRNGWRPVHVAGRQEVDQVAGSFELLVNFRQKRSAECPLIAHSAFQCLTEKATDCGGATLPLIRLAIIP
jgi:hypothetical protein